MPPTLSSREYGSSHSSGFGRPLSALGLGKENLPIFEAGAVDFVEFRQPNRASTSAESARRQGSEPAAAQLLQKDRDSAGHRAALPGPPAIISVSPAVFRRHASPAGGSMPSRSVKHAASNCNLFWWEGRNARAGVDRQFGRRSSISRRCFNSCAAQRSEGEASVGKERWNTVVCPGTGGQRNRILRCLPCFSAKREDAGACDRSLQIAAAFPDCSF